MTQRPIAHRPPRPPSPSGEPFYRRPSGPGAPPRPPTDDHGHRHDHAHDAPHDHAHDAPHDHTHDAPHDHAHDHPPVAIETFPGPHHEDHHHHDGDARHEHRRADRSDEQVFSNEKRVIDRIVALVAERVEEIVQRRVEEILARHLGSQRRGPEGNDGGRR